MMALNIIADRMALCGVASCIIFRIPNTGKEPTKRAGMIAKYFAIIPAIFVGSFPVLGILNIMRLATPQSAILSAIIFNAIIIPLLIPLSLKGIQYRATTAMALLWRNLLIYGIGGLILPFVGIKLIDLMIVFLRLA